MEEMHRKKDEVLGQLDKLIEQEKKFIAAVLQSERDKFARDLERYQRATLEGSTDLGQHLGTLEMLRSRFDGDARDVFPLSHKDFAIIIEEQGGGAERLLRAKMRGGTEKFNQLMQMLGLPPLPEGMETAIIECGDCDDETCPIHGESGLMKMIGLPTAKEVEDAEPVGKIGTVEEKASCDDSDCGACEPVSEDTPESAKDPVGATATG